MLSKEEVRLMLNKPHKLKHRVLIALLYGCGLRLNEVRNLKVEDIDLERSTLIVRKSKTGETVVCQWAQPLLLFYGIT